MPDKAVLVEALRRCPLFAKADERTLDEIARHLRRRRFRRDEIIFHQGDVGDSLLVVASGAVKIVLPSLNGEEAIIATLRPSDYFGELALLDGQPRSATAVAVEPTETLSLTREQLNRLLDTDPELRASLLAGIAGELRRLTAQVEELHFLDLAGRLAKRLVRMARDAGAADGAGGASLEWPYTQSELAAMIGGTPQSVNRLLTEMLDEGLVSIERDRLVIPDVDRLEQRADR